jgi:YD repeat-containing protein
MMKREVYPNGRAVEFSYDAAFRLASLKDPYGFVNQVAYDGEGKLDALTHSALGTATFDYDGPDRQIGSARNFALL